MASQFREIVLHAVVGFPRDFRPRAIFTPEILLGVQPIRRVSLNQILPHPNEWGGWPARVFEAICRLDTVRAHVFVTLPVSESSQGPNSSVWGFIHPLKRDLVATRVALLEVGPREISTCSLMVREELIAPREGQELEAQYERLETLGFRNRFVFSERTNGSPLRLFERWIPPSPEEEAIEKWAGRVLGACSDRESV